jgi:hypothetical protein
MTTQEISPPWLSPELSANRTREGETRTAAGEETVAEDVNRDEDVDVARPRLWG